VLALICVVNCLTNVVFCSGDGAVAATGCRRNRRRRIRYVTFCQPRSLQQLAILTRQILEWDGSCASSEPMDDIAEMSVQAINELDDSNL
jgi:hypothetical protein